MNNNFKNQFKDLKIGSHLALLYKSQEEWVKAVSEFITAAIEKDEKVLHVNGEFSADFVKNKLKDNDIEVNNLIEKGELLFLNRDEIYNNDFNINKILNSLKEEANKALTEGYSCLNITGEISQILKQKNSFHKIVNYEKQVDKELFNKYPIKALCSYNMGLFDEQLIKNIIKLHPYILWNNYIYQNPYYISLESFDNQNIYKKELDEWLNNIKNYHAEKEMHNRNLAEEKSKFEFIFNEIGEALFIQGFWKDSYSKFKLVNKKACNLLDYTKDELLNKRPMEIIEEDDLNKLRQDDLKEKLLDGQEVKFNVNIVTKYGEKIPVENKSHVFEYQGEKLVLTVTRDKRESIKKQKKLKKQYNEIKEKNQRLEILNKRLNNLLNIITELSKYSIEDEVKFLKRLFRTAFEIVPQANLGSVYIYKENQVNFLDTIGHDINKLNSAQIPVENFRKYGQVVREDNINGDLDQRVSNKKLDLFNKGTEPIKETLTFDIEGIEGYIGGISLDIKVGSNNTFNDISLNIFSAFKDIADSFYKIQNYDKLRGDFTKELALSLIHMLEFHDQYTNGHSENVAILASDFAEYLNLEQKEISRIYWAGLVHDIGKIIIPSFILNKEGKLTQQEYEIVKNHPKWAYETLIRSNQLSDIAEYVLYHHERWDGRGYPKGLAEDNIPLISQILSLCDSWDAMRSNRSYREALTYDQAVNELVENKDKQHSAKLVDEFIEMVNIESDKLFFHK